MARGFPRWRGDIARRFRLSLLAVVAGLLLPGLHAEAAGATAPARTRAELRPAYTLTGYSPADRFSNPHGIALDERNRILYVADTDKGRVVGFSLQGLPKLLLPVDGIAAPYNLAVDAQGQLYVSDKNAPTLCRVDGQGKTVAKIDLSGVGTVAPPRLRGLAVDRRGRLYVGDQASGCVLVCDADGQVRSRIGSPGEAPGQLKMVEDVALDRVGRVYVIDSVGVAVNVFDPGGKFIFRFGTISPDQDGLLQPVSVALDRHDQVWVVDMNAHALRVFDGRGFPVKRLGADTPGGFERFLFPVSVAFDPMGHVYVVEQTAGQVQVFTLDNPFRPFRA